MEESIVERIKRLCHEKGVTVAQMQRDLGFKKGGVYKWNEFKPSTPAVQKMSAYFGKSMAYILNGADEPQQATDNVLDARNELDKLLYLVEHNINIMYNEQRMSEFQRQVLVDSINHAISVVDICQNA